MRFFLFLLLLASPAAAQYAANLTLQKSNFLQGEPLLAFVTITNRSGADAIVGGVGSRPWLQFQFEDSQGRQLAPVPISSRDAITLKAGSTTRHTVEIEGSASTADVGTFYTVASIYHPPSSQYYATNRSRITVTDSKPMFDESFGVPQGFPQAGRARRYQAIIFRDIDSVTLYARMVDDRSKERLSTQLLGPIIHSIQPQMAIDSKNHFHLLFMAQPRVFCHTIMKPDGQIAKRSYYRDLEGSRPSLIMIKNGAEIIGGEYFDPSKPPVRKGPAIRKASERPSGL
jgi:hypothetical protein